MTGTTVLSRSEEETFRFAEDLGRSLTPPAVVLLFGDLGAGKTLFSKGLAAGLGVADVDEVSSPTFTLINRYQGRAPVYHIDLYRIEGIAVEGLGLDDIFDDPKNVVIVEWAERLNRVPAHATRVFLEYVDERSRTIRRG